jgi:hypothetical protein
MQGQSSNRSDATLSFSMATSACDLAVTGMDLVVVRG